MRFTVRANSKESSERKRPILKANAKSQNNRTRHSYATVQESGPLLTQLKRSQSSHLRSQNRKQKNIQNHKHQMKEDHPSPHTNLTYTHLLLRRANPFMQQLLPMMLQAPPQRNTGIQPKDSTSEAQRERLCSYLQQAVDLAEATDGDFDDDSIGDEQESSPK
jgi:hypothetical protein